GRSGWSARCYRRVHGRGRGVSRRRAAWGAAAGGAVPGWSAMDAPDDLVLRAVTADDVPALTCLLHAAYAALAAEGLNVTGATQDEATTASRTLRVGESWVLTDRAGRLLGTVAVSSPPGRGIRSLT